MWVGFALTISLASLEGAGNVESCFHPLHAYREFQQGVRVTWNDIHTDARGCVHCLLDDLPSVRGTVDDDSMTHMNSHVSDRPVGVVDRKTVFEEDECSHGKNANHRDADIRLVDCIAREVNPTWANTHLVSVEQLNASGACSGSARLK